MIVFALRKERRI